MCNVQQTCDRVPPCNYEMADLAGTPKPVWKTKNQHRSSPPQEPKINDIHPLKTLKNTKVTQCNKKTARSAKINLFHQNPRNCSVCYIRYAVSRKSKYRSGFDSIFYGSIFVNSALFHVFCNVLSVRFCNFSISGQ